MTTPSLSPVGGVSTRSNYGTTSHPLASGAEPRQSSSLTIACIGGIAGMALTTAGIIQSATSNSDSHSYQVGMGLMIGGIALSSICALWGRWLVLHGGSFSNRSNHGSVSPSIASDHKPRRYSIMSAISNNPITTGAIVGIAGIALMITGFVLLTKYENNSDSRLFSAGFGLLIGGAVLDIIAIGISIQLSRRTSTGSTSNFRPPLMYYHQPTWHDEPVPNPWHGIVPHAHPFTTQSRLY